MRSGRERAAAATGQEDEKRAARRTRAINLLVETAERARSFNDLLYRARIQSLAADALWTYDEARARQIFKRAWEAAISSDRADERAEREEAAIFYSSDEAAWTAARDEVISKVATRDAKLADAFLREMIEERERAGGGGAEAKINQPTRRTPWREPSALGVRRLALAYELLNSGDVRRAAQAAAPLIAEGVSGDFMEFILRLRAHGGGASEADALYAQLIASAAASPQTDANDLLLLSSRIVSPQLLVVVDEKGGLQFRAVANARPNQNRSQNAAPAPFYELAIKVLLGRAPARSSNPVQDRVARYVATGRLLPLFERALPQYAQFAPTMRSQMAAISGEMEAVRRDALNAQFELTSLTGKNASDPLAPQLEQLTRARDNYERDRISLSIVKRAVRELFWDRAQRAAYSIEDGDLRRAALAFIVVNQIADISRAYMDDKEDDFEAVARFVRRSEAPAFASAWGLAQASVIATRKRDAEAVAALLSEAESYAAREDRNSRRSIAAYIVITHAAAHTGQIERAWDLLTQLVRAVNSTDGYMGDETSLETSAASAVAPDVAEALRIEADAFRLDRIFATMARIDFDKTAAQAQALMGEIPRSYARIATARAELEKQ